jgi:hypothetical protein
MRLKIPSIRMLITPHVHQPVMLWLLWLGCRRMRGFAGVLNLPCHF